MRTRVLLLCAVLINGCQHVPQSTEVTEGAAKSRTRDSAEKAEQQTGEALETSERARRIHLELVRQMVDKGLYYAAIAHLDAEGEAGQSPEGLWLRAEALRHIDRHDEAGAIYQQLTDGPLAGAAYRGLGLLAAERRDYGSAVKHLSRARELSPTDPRIRNDLGFALLLAGRTAEARHQLATALELGKGDVRSTHNLILLYLATGDTEHARLLAERQEVSMEDLERLRQKAQAIRAGWSVAANPAAATPEVAVQSTPSPQTEAATGNRAEAVAAKTPGSASERPKTVVEAPAAPRARAATLEAVATATAETAAKAAPEKAAANRVKAAAAKTPEIRSEPAEAVAEAPAAPPVRAEIPENAAEEADTRVTEQVESQAAPEMAGGNPPAAEKTSDAKSEETPETTAEVPAAEPEAPEADSEDTVVPATAETEPQAAIKTAADILEKAVVAKTPGSLSEPPEAATEASPAPQAQAETPEATAEETAAPETDETTPPAAPETVQDGSAGESSPPTPVSDDIDAWKSAWESRDVDAYLGHYSPRFTPPSGSLEQWKQHRRAAIRKPVWITVGISDLEIKIDGDRATARFIQQYAASNYRDVTNKKLVLQKENDAWKIVEEVSF